VGQAALLLPPVPLRPSDLVATKQSPGFALWKYLGCGGCRPSYMFKGSN